MEIKSLVIKGNRSQAERAAAQRGIPFAFNTERKNETIGHTTADINTLNAWFCEPPYTGLMPIGTLLLWTPGGPNV